MNARAIAIVVFGVLLVASLVLTYWTARRTTSAGEFWAAGSGISPTRNAIATVGDVLSGSALLGGVGLYFLVGYDGLFYLVLPLLAWIPILLFTAERLRNLGRFTLTDVLVRRFDSGRIRLLLAVSTLFISGMYLLAQLVVAGNLFSLLLGVNFAAGVVLTGLVIVFYVAVGGMHATTLIQAVKAFLMVGMVVLLCVLLMVKFGGDFGELWSRATAPFGNLDPLRPGNLLHNEWDTLSTALSLLLGLAGLPHVMMRFFTVRNSADARRSAVGAIGIITVTSLMIALISLGAAALLRGDRQELAATGGNLATPRLAEALGGGSGTTGGAVTLGVLAAVAFASVIAVAAGLLINASSAAVRDVWSQLGRRSASAGREVPRARIATVGLGVLVTVVAIILGPTVNSTLLVTLAFAIAASTNFPVLVLTLTWRRFTLAGAVGTVVAGLVSALVLIALGPRFWPGQTPPVNLSDPTLIAMPLAFLGGCVTTVLSGRRRRAVTDFDEFQLEADVGRAEEAATPG